MRRAEIHLTTQGWAVWCGCGWQASAAHVQSAAALRDDHNRRHARFENAGQATVAFVAFVLLAAAAAAVLVVLVSTAGDAR